MNCRVGSLEIYDARRRNALSVNCRVGSLEITLFFVVRLFIVNCRVGSLESSYRSSEMIVFVNCRVGSLEIFEVILLHHILVNCRVGSLENLGSEATRQDVEEFIAFAEEYAEEAGYDINFVITDACEQNEPEADEIFEEIFNEWLKK